MKTKRADLLLSPCFHCRTAVYANKPHAALTVLAPGALQTAYAHQSCEDKSMREAAYEWAREDERDNRMYTETDFEEDL